MIRIDPHFFLEFNNKLLNFNLLILTNTLAKSEVGNVLESLKGVYSNKFYGFIPHMAGFVSYLIKSGRFIQLDNVSEATKELLAEHAIDELEIFDNNVEKATNKKQDLIDITPHQTLSIEKTSATEEEGKPNKKQPSAKVMMAFINLIDDRAKIIPKDSINNDMKFTTLSNKIKQLFKYQYAGGTLEKDQYKLEGYSLEVYNLLIEWKYNTEAFKYKNEHNL